MTLQVKVIRPGKLKIRQMRQELNGAFQKFMKANALPEYEKTVKGWKGEKPIWKIKVKTTNAQTVISVFPTNPGSKGAMKWLWLDKGTKEHLIFPRPENRSQRLFFKRDYKAGSTPGKLETVPGKKSGPTIVSRGVIHPGFPPRGWSIIIQKDLQKRLDKVGKIIMKNVAIVSGHKI